MNRFGYLLLAAILLIALLFRFFIIYFLPIYQISTGPLALPSWFTISLGLINLILLFSIFQKETNFTVGLIGALLYALSPWTGYLEVAANFYIILMTILLVFLKVVQLLNINRKYVLLGVILILIIFIYRFNQVTLFLDVGLINAVNSFRGETSQTIFSPLGKVIENRYIYLSEHLVFNFLKQFTPATYFTNQQKLLSFSFTPPIYLGFIIPFLFGLFKIIKSAKVNIYKMIMVIILLIPSILSKDSPDLTRLLVVSPIIFFVTSNGLFEFILNYKKGVFRFLLFLTLSMIFIQFITTLFDIAIREPIRLQMFLGKT